MKDKVIMSIVVLRELTESMCAHSTSELCYGKAYITKCSKVYQYVLDYMLPNPPSQACVPTVLIALLLKSMQILRRVPHYTTTTHFIALIKRAQNALVEYIRTLSPYVRMNCVFACGGNATMFQSLDAVLYP